MSLLRIYLDINYPKRLVDALVTIHSLQKEKRFEIIQWTNQSIDENQLDTSIFLLVDYGKRKLEIPTLKHFEDGYRVIACKAGIIDKIDRFEFAMTVLRVWPFIIEKAEEYKGPFLFTFKYEGRKLNRVG